MPVPALALNASDRPDRGLRHLRRETVIPAALPDAFAFFADAANLQQLTPPFLHFVIDTPMPVAMQEGAIIDYRISVRGFPLRWRTRIDVWEENRHFVDRQLIGPYLWWHHEHCFAPEGAGTRMVDHVEYLPRLRFISHWLVERDLGRIFDFRERALQRLFA